MARSIRPGSAAPSAGQYSIVGPRGGMTNQQRTAVRGEPMPPTRPSRDRVTFWLTVPGTGAGRGGK